MTIFDGWDDPRPTSKCRHCHGTGMADEHNECGFCFNYRCDCTEDRQCELCDAFLADMPKTFSEYAEVRREQLSQEGREALEVFNNAIKEEGGNTMRWRVYDAADWLCKVTGHRWCYRLTPLWEWARSKEQS